MDELQRYVDILFADYRQYQAANKLRIKMLDELLTEKEQYQLQGKTEQEAVHLVLTSLDEFGAPAEGNCLVFKDRYHYTSNTSALLWMIAGLVLTVPLLCFGIVGPTVIMAVLLAVTMVLWLRKAGLAQSDEVSFLDMDSLRRNSVKIWLVWALCTVLWCIAASLLHNGVLPFDMVEYDGLYGKAILFSHYYIPFVFAVIPFWASGRRTIFLKQEVGAEEDIA